MYIQIVSAQPGKGKSEFSRVAYGKLEGAHVKSLSPVKGALHLVVVLIRDLVDGGLLSDGNNVDNVH